MKFLLSEPAEDLDFVGENKEWVLSEKISSNKILFLGIVFGIISSEFLTFIMKAVTLCTNLDFHAYKKLYLIIFLIPVHELMHLLFFPNPKNTIIGLSVRKVIFYVTTDDTFSKRRLLIVLIMPLFILTIIPFGFLFIINSEFIAYIALFNLIGSGVDMISSVIILRQPNNTLFRFNGAKLYVKSIVLT